MRIAPNDGELFSRQATALALSSQADAMGLLARLRAEGDGNTLFNRDVALDPAARGWVQLRYQDLDVERASDQVGFGARSTATQVGTDWTLGQGTRLGLAVGTDNAWLHDGLGSRGRSDVTRVALYGSQLIGPLGVSAMLGYAHAREHAWRQTGIGLAFSSRGTDAATAALQLALPLDVGQAQLTPIAGVVVTRLTGEAFAETGDVPEAFKVSGQARRETLVSPYAALGLSRSFEQASGVRWTPELHVGYRRAQAGQGQRYALTAADGTLFDGNRDTLSRDVGEAGAALTAHRGPWTLSLAWRGQWADGWSDQQGTLSLRATF